jgi:hypothetical protein
MTETTSDAPPQPAPSTNGTDPKQPRRGSKSPRRPRTRQKIAQTVQADLAARRQRASDQPIPYVMAYGNITKALAGIANASTPERFTQDFLSTKLGLKGGSARPVIPFLKRVGFLTSDGAPTELYKRYRNESHRGSALAAATRQGFKALYEVNEYAHDLKPNDLKGLVVQVTGMDPSSSTIPAITGSFNALKTGATFDHDGRELPADGNKAVEALHPLPPKVAGLNLGYTINLHLPATSDIAVFNAIFKSLREHILGE